MVGNSKASSYGAPSLSRDRRIKMRINKKINKRNFKSMVLMNLNLIFSKIMNFNLKIKT